MAGQIEMLLADPTVEDICFTKFDCGFSNHSDGPRRRVDVMFDSDAAMKEWVSYMALTSGGAG
jgi:Flp pilus assembly CpaF family ATPase